MGTRQSFSNEFKQALVAKILSRGNRTIEEICQSEGVGKSTAANWLKSRGSFTDMAKQSKKSRRTPEAKLKALIETASLSESELGAYLRKEGLFSHELDEWRKEILSSMQPAGKSKSGKDERDQKIKVLEKEILRKDKALAEATALLILQKKVNLIWGNKDEDEE